MSRWHRNQRARRGDALQRQTILVDQQSKRVVEQRIVKAGRGVVLRRLGVATRGNEDGFPSDRRVDCRLHRAKTTVSEAVDQDEGFAADGDLFDVGQSVDVSAVGDDPYVVLDFEVVGAVVAHNLVDIAAAVDGIGIGAAIDSVVVSTSIDRIFASPTVEGVLTVETGQAVVPAEPIQGVVAVSTLEVVRSLGTGDRERARSRVWIEPVILLDAGVSVVGNVVDSVALVDDAVAGILDCIARCRYILGVDKVEECLFLPGPLEGVAGDIEAALQSNTRMPTGVMVAGV